MKNRSILLGTFLLFVGMCAWAQSDSSAYRQQALKIAMDDFYSHVTTSGGDVFLASQNNLTQYRGVEFECKEQEVFSSAETEANKLNGIAWKGTVVVFCKTVYRSYSRNIHYIYCWDDWRSTAGYLEIRSYFLENKKSKWTVHNGYGMELSETWKGNILFPPDRIPADSENVDLQKLCASFAGSSPNVQTAGSSPLNGSSGQAKIEKPSVKPDVNSRNSPRGSTERAPADVVVTVEGEKITHGEIMQGVQAKLEQNSKADPSQQSAETTQEFYKQTLDTLIANVLLSAAAGKSGISVSEAELAKEVSNVEANAPKGTTLRESLAANNINFNQWRNDLRKQMLVRKLVDQKTANVPKVTAAELTKYYEENSKSFKTPESVTASHILVAFSPEDTSASKAQKKLKIQKIRADILAGGDFATIAREKSDCPSSKNGGDLSPFVRGQMVLPFEKVAFDLPIGRVSDVVETQFGYHLVKVTNHQQAHIRPLMEVKDQLQEYLTGKKKQEALLAYIEELKKKAKIAYSTPATQSSNRTTYAPAGVLLAEGFDYPIGMVGESVPEQITPERNNLFPNNPVDNPKRYATSLDAGWRNDQDVGSYYIEASKVQGTWLWEGLHAGEDWNKGKGSNDVGESVRCVANGQVVAIKPVLGSVPSTAGYVMVVRHWMPNNRDCVDSLYVHIAPDRNRGSSNSKGIIGDESDFTYKVGSAVAKGCVIGVIGAVSSFPPHLHFEMRNKKIDVTGNLWPNSTGDAYYGPKVGTDGNRSPEIKQSDVEEAFLLMQADGIIDPSDFIDDHRS